MKNQFFGILYFLLVIGQMILCTYSQFTPYVVLSMLPAMILCMPLTVRTPLCMIIAFASGLAVDWLAEGLIGINAASLIPVAYARMTFVRIFLGEDLISRKEAFTFRKNGIGKILISLLSSYILFFAVYIFLDGAGERTFMFNVLRLLLSLVFSVALGLIVVGSLNKEDRK